MTEYLDKWDGDIIRALRFQDEEICELAADEIERLRAALEEIASVKLYSFGLAHEDGAIVHEGEKEFMLRRDARAICDIARAALAQGGDA
jgi:hypothetical protein